MRCVVTGGTGFLGSALVKRLESDGHEAVVVSRSKGHDITRPESLRAPFSGAEAVFHLAALVQSRPGPFSQINLDGLTNVLRAAEEAGVERFVNVSSFTVFGPSGTHDHQESSIPQRERFFHGYDETKYRGYRLAQEWYERVPVNTVFPTVIFGPGPMTEGNILVRLLQRWRSLRVAAMQAFGRPVWNYVFVEDVAEGLLRCLSGPVGEDYILGGENRSIRQLLEAYRAVCGRRILGLGLPDSLFRIVAYAEDALSRITGAPPLVLPATADFFLCDWRFSSQKAAEGIGYSPRSLLQGLEETERWMRDRKGPST